MALIIGIDPGTSTGFAAWDKAAQKLLRVDTLKLHEAMFTLADMHDRGLIEHVVYEDAHLRTWFGNHSAKKDRAKLQGAGSIKRDCTIWSEFLVDRGIPYLAVKPSAGSTKWTAEHFKRVTGWTGRTSEHGRDAAVLIIGRKQ